MRNCELADVHKACFASKIPKQSTKNLRHIIATTTPAKCHLPASRSNEFWLNIVVQVSNTFNWHVSNYSFKARN